eukprot:6175278-Pleurochrysis_carterae.AAC.1
MGLECAMLCNRLCCASLSSDVQAWPTRMRDLIHTLGRLQTGACALASDAMSSDQLPEKVLYHVMKHSGCTGMTLGVVV